MNNVTSYEINIFRPMLSDIYGIIENNDRIGAN